MKKVTWAIGLVISVSAFADQESLGKSIWAQQAIMAIHQINSDTYIKDQNEIAKYFTSNAWKTYLQGLDKVKFQQFLETNHYRVDAVALKPVTLKPLEQGNWQASLPVLIQYKNPQYDQLQTIDVTMQFKPAALGQGVLGYQIISFASKVIDKPCRCMVEKGKANISL